MYTICYIYTSTHGKEIASITAQNRPTKPIKKRLALHTHSGWKRRKFLMRCTWHFSPIIDVHVLLLHYDWLTFGVCKLGGETVHTRTISHRSGQNESFLFSCESFSEKVCVYGATFASHIFRVLRMFKARSCGAFLAQSATDQNHTFQYFF